MSAEPLGSEEIILGGLSYPIIGQVARALASSWAPKLTIGEYSSADDPYRSVYGVGDLTGGIGLDVLDDAAAPNRCRFSTHDTTRRRHIRHLPRTYGKRKGSDGRDRIGADTLENRQTQQIVEFSPPMSEVTRIFQSPPSSAFPNEVVYFTESPNGNVQQIRRLPGGAYSGVDVRHYVYAATFVKDYILTGHARGVNAYRVIASGNYEIKWFSESGVFAFIEWDEKLWVLKADGVSWAVSKDFADLESEVGKSPGDFQGLGLTATAAGNPYGVQYFFRGPNPAGAGDVLYGSAKTGVYYFNATEEVWQPTAINIPHHDENGLAALTWRGAIWYSAVGAAIYRLDFNGPVLTLEEIGPRQDAGLPVEFVQTKITKLVPTTQGMACVLNPSARQEETVTRYESEARLAGLLNLVRPQAHTRSLVLLRKHQGWHTAHVGELGEEIHDAAFIEDTLYLGMSGKLLQVGVEVNPLETQSWQRIRYEETAETTTAWFTGGASNAEKVALQLLLDCIWINIGGGVARGAEGVIDVFYGLDYQPGWTRLNAPVVYRRGAGNVIEGVASGGWEIGADRRYPPLRFGDGGGIRFNAIRLLLRTQQGWFSGSDWSSPDIEGLTLEYYKRLGVEQRYQYNVRVKLEAGYGGRSPEQLRADLAAVAGSSLLTRFRYRSAEGWRESHVRVVGMVQSEPTGKAALGEAHLTLLEL